MDYKLIYLTTAKVQEKVNADKDTKLIDVRPVDAYNGWKMKGEPRGGHIPGAKSLPSKWLTYIDWPDIVESKGICQSDNLILYGYDEKNVEQTAELFLRAGFNNVSVYPYFLSEWCPDSSLPMDGLVRYRHLVSADWLYSLNTTGDAPEYDNDKYVICQAHYGNKKVYEEGHIPGAIPIDTNALESTTTWNVRPAHELKAALEQAGITYDTTVILYGRYAFPDKDDPYPGSSAGHLGAMRCALIMLYAGVEDVRVLNGGLQSWTDAGMSMTDEEPSIKPVNDFGTEVPQHPELFVDTPEAKRILQAPDENLVSVRSWREIIGEVSGYNYIEKKGRIPGAVFGNCGSDAYHMENYRNVDHTTRERQEIEQMWRNVGIVPEKRNVFYCGTGWRGSEAFFNAWLMGWPDIAVYDGGWFEWTSDEDNPCETGTPN